MSLDGNLLIVLIGAFMLIAMAPIHAGARIVADLYGLDDEDNLPKPSLWTALPKHPSLIVTVPLGVAFYYTPFVLVYVCAVQLYLVAPLPFCDMTPVVLLCPSA